MRLLLASSVLALSEIPQQVPNSDKKFVNTWTNFWAKIDGEDTVQEQQQEQEPEDVEEVNWWANLSRPSKEKKTEGEWLLVRMDEDLPEGYRLANAIEVEEHMSEVQEFMRDPWVIACLADDKRVLGEGYKSVIEDNNNCGEKLLRVMTEEEKLENKLFEAECECSDETNYMYGNCNDLKWKEKRICYVKNEKNCERAEYDDIAGSWWSNEVCPQDSEDLPKEKKKDCILCADDLLDEKPECTCTDEIINLYGGCMGLGWNKRQLCYVENKDHCPDAQFDKKNNKWWSHDACDVVQQKLDLEKEQCECPNGMAANWADCMPVFRNVHCISCDTGFKLTGFSECEPYEEPKTTAPTTTAAPEPVNTECTCTNLRNGLYGTCGGILYEGKVICYVENPDYCEDAEYDEAVDAYWSFIACPDNKVCKCENGYPSFGEACPIPNFEHCSSCYFGFQLNHFNECEEIIPETPKPVETTVAVSTTEEQSNCEEWVCTDGLVKDEAWTSWGDCLPEDCNAVCCKVEKVVPTSPTPEWFNKISNTVNEKIENLTEQVTDTFEQVSDKLEEFSNEDWFCNCNDHVYDGYGNCEGEKWNHRVICYVANPDSKACDSYHMLYDFTNGESYSHELCKQPEPVADPDVPEAQTSVPVVPTEEKQTLPEKLPVEPISVPEEIEEVPEEPVTPVFCSEFCGENGMFVKTEMKTEKCIVHDCSTECCDPILPGANKDTQIVPVEEESEEEFGIEQEMEEEVPEKIVPVEEESEEELEIEQEMEEVPEIRRSEDEDCWSECDEKNGSCDWCGNMGKCCRKGHVGGGCNGQEGPEGRHICVYAPIDVPLDCEDSTEKVFGYTCEEWKWNANEKNREWNMSTWAKIDGICYDADYGYAKIKILNEGCKKLCQPAVCAPKYPEDDCWSPCNEQNGECDWCQFGGKCCRQGHVEGGCNGEEGLPDRHTCIYDPKLDFVFSKVRPSRQLKDSLRGSIAVESQDHLHYKRFLEREINGAKKVRERRKHRERVAEDQQRYQEQQQLQQQLRSRGKSTKVQYGRQNRRQNRFLKKKNGAQKVRERRRHRARVAEDQKRHQEQQQLRNRGQPTNNNSRLCIGRLCLR